MLAVLPVCLPVTTTCATETGFYRVSVSLDVAMLVANGSNSRNLGENIARGGRLSQRQREVREREEVGLAWVW